MANGWVTGAEYCLDAFDVKSGGGAYLRRLWLPSRYEMGPETKEKGLLYYVLFI